MQRVLTLAKYLPAVLCGLLIMAGVVSLYAPIHAAVELPWEEPEYAGVDCRWGTVWIWRASSDWNPSSNRGGATGSRKVVTKGLDWQHVEYCLAPPIFVTYLSAPLILILSLSLPVAVGCWTHFRFPLWSWFAWTALLAIELAFYLR